MIPRQIQVVGMARTGTMHIAAMYKKLFVANNIDGIAQHQSPLNGLSPDIYFVNSDWRQSPNMSVLNQKYPYLRFVILYRDVEENCSSLHNFYADRKHSDKNLKPEEYVDSYWLQVYDSIADQLSMLNPKPCLMLSKDYFAGKHNDLLLDIFDFPKTEKNFDVINGHLKCSVNRSRHRAASLKLSEKIKEDCDRVGRFIAEQCSGSWIEKEVYQK